MVFLICRCLLLYFELPLSVFDLFNVLSIKEMCCDDLIKKKIMSTYVRDKCR